MGLIRLLAGVVVGIAFLFRVAFAAVAAVVAHSIVRSMVASGELPAEPFGIAAYGLPQTLFGIPTVYAAGIGLFVLLVLFGDGGGNGHSDGFADGGDGGGGGGDGGGE